MPSGRFVSGVTQGLRWARLRLLGCASPGLDRGPRLAAGTERRRRWQDHEQYLAGLTEVLERVDATRLIVMGDFNQVYRAGRPRAS